MSDQRAGKNSENADADADADLAREILEGRKFTLEEAIARMAGPGALKGESPVAALQQAEFEIGNWLRSRLTDAGGQLEAVLNRRVKNSERLLNNFDQPLVVLAGYCQEMLSSEHSLHALVREIDVEWGRAMGERPYFEREDSPHHPDDPYTLESVRNALSGILNQLAAERPHP